MMYSWYNYPIKYPRDVCAPGDATNALGGALMTDIIPQTNNNRIAGIYCITNTLNGHKYIGSAVNIARRWSGHKSKLNKNIHHSRHLQNAWNKYGEQCFVFETVLLCNVESRLYYEQVLLDGLKPVYNIAICAAASMQGLHHSAEICAKLSDTNKGELNPMFGKHWSEEAKRKISESQKGNTNPLGHHHTPETREKMSKAQKGELGSMFGKHHTDEVKRKISETHAGELHWNFGKHTSEETRRKISESQRKSWQERTMTK